MTLPERNDPCPCGSGKKYKKCCLGKAASATSQNALLQLQTAEQHHLADRLVEAETLYREVLQSDPRNRVALHRLGLLAHQLGHQQAALELISEGCRLHPADPLLHSSMGIVQMALGRYEAAADSFRKALALHPDHATWSDLALALFNLGRLEEAELACHEAMRLSPDYVEASYNLGTVLLEQDRIEEAIACFQRVLALRPDLAQGHFNLGLAYETLGRLDEAEPCYRQALALSPTLIQARHNLGNILLKRGQIEEALSSLDRALALQPDFAWTHDVRLCTLNYLPEWTPAMVYPVAQEYAQRIEAPLKPFWPRHANVRDPGRRLKVGYLSPDFRGHSVAFFMEPILAHHDKGAVEVYGYYNNTKQDAATERLQRHADHWIPCRYLTDEQLAERIRSDGIDILVDLAGHTAGNRLLTFARKPAPVQVSYLGYPATTGLSAMDYRLVTWDTDPAGAERWHTERLYRLPRSLWCYRPAPDLPAVAPRTPARHTGFVTFGSLNNIAKVSEATVAAWSELLQRVPGSQLVMTNVPEGEACALIAQRFAARGIGADRVQLRGKLSQTDYEAQLNAIDIALDPFPYTGTTTTCDVLWRGIPVVTLIGETSVARSGYALLKLIGLSELAAPDTAGYLDTAAALATNLDRLEMLRQGLRARMEASPLRDEAGMTRDLEAAYRALWQAWCAGGTEV